MSIDVMGVGHVVLKVTDLDRALDFYSTTLGLSEVARQDFGDGTMGVLVEWPEHRDIGLVEVASDARRPQGSDIGFYHVALKIGDDLHALRAAKTRLEERVSSDPLRESCHRWPHRLNSCARRTAPDPGRLLVVEARVTAAGSMDPAFSP